MLLKTTLYFSKDHHISVVDSIVTALMSVMERWNEVSMCVIKELRRGVLAGVRGYEFRPLPWAVSCKGLRVIFWDGGVRIPPGLGCPGQPVCV